MMSRSYHIWEIGHEALHEKASVVEEGWIKITCEHSEGMDQHTMAIHGH